MSQKESFLNLRRLRSVDLRFPDTSDEMAFVGSNKVVLQKTTFVCCILFVGGTLNHSLPLWITEVERSDNPLTLSSFDKRFEHIIMVGGLVFAASLLAVMIICHLRWHCFKWVHWEALITGFMCYGVALIFYGMVVEQYDIWEGMANNKAIELNSLLIVDAIVTAACLFMPIRICILWTLPFFAFMSFILAVVVHGLQADTLSPIFVLLCLVVFSVGGSFRHEQHVRKEFLSMKVVECKDSEIQEIAALSQGMQSVAETLCDLVIKLTQDLRIIDDGSLRSSFLSPLLDTSDSISFMDLFDACDAQRFSNLLSLVDESKMPQCLPVTLRFSRGSSIEVKLLVADVRHGQMQYLVGIQAERGEISHAAGTLLPIVESSSFHRENHQGPESEISFLLSVTTGTLKTSSETATVTSNGRRSSRGNSTVALGIEASTQTPNVFGSRSKEVQTELTLKSELFKPERRPPAMPLDRDRLPPLWVERILHRAHSFDGSRRRRQGKIENNSIIVTPGVGKPVLKNFSATTLKSVEFACSLLVKRINPQGVACCPWHLGMEYIAQAVKAPRTKCLVKFEPFKGWQCDYCGMMNEIDDIDCMVCYQEREHPQREVCLMVL